MPESIEPQRILVVDDQSGIRRLLRRVLLDAGHEVVDAASGSEALAQVGQGDSVTLAFVDITMPEMDGITLTIALRDRLPDLPVVLMSGFDMDDVLASGPAMAPQPQFIEKPFRIEQVLQAVTAAIAPTVSR